MKSSPFRIFLLVLLVVLLLLPLQWLPDLTIGSYEVKRVALLDDVLPATATATATASATPADSLQRKLPAVKPAFKDSCPPGIVCIEDYADETNRGMGGR